MTVTSQAPDLDLIRSVMQEHALAPDDLLGAFVGGSVARGWQHARSDADLYVVTEQPFTGATSGFHPVALEPAAVPTHVAYLDGRRWELRYWLLDQVEQLLAKASWDRFEDADPTGSAITLHETAFLSRLDKGLDVHGAAWIGATRQRIADCALRSMLTLRFLTAADASVEDALGMLESGDKDSAVLAARTALEHAVDALTANAGEYGIEEKWRARRVRAIASPVLPFDRYWQLLTMRSFAPEQPEKWVESVLRLCREVAVEVEV